MSQNSPRDESVTIHRLLSGSPLHLSHEMVEPCQFSPAEPVDCYGFIPPPLPSFSPSHRSDAGRPSSRGRPGTPCRERPGRSRRRGCGRLPETPRPRPRRSAAPARGAAPGSGSTGRPCRAPHGARPPGRARIGPEPGNPCRISGQAASPRWPRERN